MPNTTNTGRARATGKVGGARMSMPQATGMVRTSDATEFARTERQRLPSEIQRARLLAAAIRAIDELGCAKVSIADITDRAKISRRTFYEHFPNGKACLQAAFAEIAQRVEVELVAGELDDLEWRERMRRGLWIILSFFEREPVLARVGIVQALRAEPQLLAEREALFSRLSAAVDEGRQQGPRAAQCSPLTAEGLVGAVFTILYKRVLSEDTQPLTTLFGELMGTIVLPYLGATAARRERARPTPAPLRPSEQGELGSEQFATNPLENIQMRITYRTMRVLECVGSDPGASNRQVADRAGIPDPGQVSKLLARLEGIGLLTNSGKRAPKGAPNEWHLTPTGERVVRSVGAYGGGLHGVGVKQA
jgi:AcrR family transcriptional regulator/DNA-binding MarR family transcriptional regulator